jgi:hypothetical protein
MRPKSFLHSFDIAEVVRGRGAFSKALAEDLGYKKGWDEDGDAAREGKSETWDRP